MRSTVRPSSLYRSEARRGSGVVLKRVAIRVDPAAVVRWLRNCLRNCGGAEEGFTLIEVLASALVVVLLAGAALISFAGTNKTSYEARLHSDAQALAQQNKNYLRGLNVAELSNLNKTVTTAKMDGVVFTVQENATYVTDAANAASCTSPSVDYLQTTSTVTWPNMGNEKPVVVSSVLTPPVGSISSSAGGIAVSVNGLAGMNVQISGPTNATGLTGANGCVLFGDLPAGNSTVSTWPSIGTYVDQASGQAVTATSPDVASQPVGVVGGRVTSAPFYVATPGTINFTFTSTIGGSSPPAAGAIGVVAYSNNLESNFFRLCTLYDGATCPAVNNGDTSFPASDWPQVAGVSQIEATPLYPMSGAYTVYAGTCSANAPSANGATDPAATVVSSQTSTAVVKVPALIIQFNSGTSASNPGSPMMPANLYIKDKGCNVRYQGYPDDGTTPPAVTANKSPQMAAIPVNHNYPTQSTNGLLAYPGMPYGRYEVCVGYGTSYWATSVTNGGPGSQTITFYKGSPTGSLSGELGSNGC